MLDLVRKDIAAAGWLLLLVLAVGGVQLGTFATLGPAFLPAAFLFTGLLAFGSIPVEDLHRTETLWNSLPISRGQIVGGRYLTVLAGTLTGLALSGAIGQATVRWMPREGNFEAGFVGIRALALVFTFTILLAALYLPLYFRFGTGRAVILASAVSVGSLLIVSTAVQIYLFARGKPLPLFDPETWREAGPAVRERLAAWIEPRRGRILVLMAAFSLAALGCSALVSRRLYEDRDL